MSSCNVVEEDSSGNLWSSGELHAQEGMENIPKAVLENNGTLSPICKFSLRGVLSLLWPAV